MLSSKQAKTKRFHLYYRCGQKFCAGCGKFFRFEHMTIDHIIPSSKGGSSRYDNLQLMCEPCNKLKADSIA